MNYKTLEFKPTFEYIWWWISLMLTECQIFGWHYSNIFKYLSHIEKSYLTLKMAAGIFFISILYHHWIVHAQVWDLHLLSFRSIVVENNYRMNRNIRINWRGHCCWICDNCGGGSEVLAARVGLLFVHQFKFYVW